MALGCGVSVMSVASLLTRAGMQQVTLSALRLKSTRAHSLTCSDGIGFREMDTRVRDAWLCQVEGTASQKAERKMTRMLVCVLVDRPRHASNRGDVRQRGGPGSIPLAG